VISVASAGAVRAAGLAEPKVEYPADQVAGSGDLTLKSKVYHAPGKQRMDMEEGEGKQIIIMRADRKLFWIVMPEQRMYMEKSLEEGKKERRDLTDCAFTQKAAGKESVNRVDAAKSEIEVSCPDTSEYSGTMWTSKEDIMVKMDAVAKGKGSKGRFRTELKNLKIGKQDPNLFEVPRIPDHPDADGNRAWRTALHRRAGGLGQEAGGPPAEKEPPESPTRKEPSKEEGTAGRRRRSP
jgi:outer membrane lipoprotein-sorting protein